jgi:phospholipid-binding lipoprotein MlaA
LICGVACFLSGSFWIMDVYMSFLRYFFILAVVVFLTDVNLVHASGFEPVTENADELEQWLDDDDFDDEFSEESDEQDADEIYDPLEPVNRVVFTVNDIMYQLIIHPAATGYRKIVPNDFQRMTRNFFNNLATPIRVVSCLLQGKVKKSGVELSRFMVNSTLGAAGLGDPADDVFDLKMSDEDFGQVLGHYGIGEGFYIYLPIIGPRNLRDSAGHIVDSFFDPISYVWESDFLTGTVVYSEKKLNEAALYQDDFDSFMEMSFDPYLAVRNAYFQNRKSEILQ